MFFPEALLNSPMFGIGLTIIVYVFCELIVNRFELNILPPFVLACPIIMGIIYFQSPHITYEQYAAGANFINFLLGPATVALALPLYRNRQTLKNNLAVIVSGVVVATVIGIVAIFVCGKLFGASEQVLLSLIPKSVTTPIAMDISSVIGGIPSLTAACVILQVCLVLPSIIKFYPGWASKTISPSVWLLVPQVTALEPVPASIKAHCSSPSAV